MEGSGNCGSSRAIWMGQTSHPTSQEWVAQKLLSLVPTVPRPAKRCVLASGDFNCSYSGRSFFTTDSAGPRNG
jgi:hypothetical protein